MICLGRFRGLALGLFFQSLPFAGKLTLVAQTSEALFFFFLSPHSFYDSPLLAFHSFHTLPGLDFLMRGYCFFDGRHHPDKCLVFTRPPVISPWLPTNSRRFFWKRGFGFCWVCLCLFGMAAHEAPCTSGICIVWARRKVRPSTPSPLIFLPPYF